MRHTIRAIEDAERLGGLVTLPDKEIFLVEYWELEQAKLGRGGVPLPFCGQVALVTGGASGIGRACVERRIRHLWMPYRFAKPAGICRAATTAFLTKRRRSTTAVIVQTELVRVPICFVR